MVGKTNTRAKYSTCIGTRYENAFVNNFEAMARHNNTGIFDVFERDLSKCEIDLCDRKIYIEKFLDICFLKIL